MPLRACIDDQQVIAPLLSSDQWRQLQEQAQQHRIQVVLPCCGSAGFLRSSKYGVQHFVHARRGTCAWGPETAEHLAIKAAIVRACHAAAYSAETEVAGPDWRADVLAVRGTTRVAFEVQWSVQTLAETVARQERYARDEIRGCWETVQ